MPDISGYIQERVKRQMYGYGYSYMSWSYGDDFQRRKNSEWQSKQIIKS